MAAPIIFDIDCNNGDDTDCYLRNGFDVVAVDADKSMCDEVSSRFSAQVKEGKCRVVYGAISETDEDVCFFVNDSCSGIILATRI
jgi:cyclopropane fatty-acyl-phospholipid synthase-like methyltransferase